VPLGWLQIILPRSYLDRSDAALLPTCTRAMSFMATVDVVSCLVQVEYSLNPDGQLCIIFDLRGAQLVQSGCLSTCYTCTTK